MKFHLLLLHGIFFKAKTIARPCRRSNFKIKRKERLVFLIFFDLFVTGTATCKSPCQSVGRSVGRSVGLSHFAFLFAFLGILRVGKFVFEHAPAQVITAPAQPTATGVVVYTALLTQPPELQFSIFYRHAGWWKGKDVRISSTSQPDASYSLAHNSYIFCPLRPGFLLLLSTKYFPFFLSHPAYRACCLQSVTACLPIFPTSQMKTTMQSLFRFT